METNNPVEGVLKAVNHGKDVPGLDKVTDFFVNLGLAGYDSLLKILFVLTMIAVVIGILITILGLVFKSADTKRWGLGTIGWSLVAFGGSVFVPLIVAGLAGLKDQIGG